MTFPAPRHSREKQTFLTLPPEMQLKIFHFLNPIDATCLGLTNKHFYSLYRAIHSNVSLTTGSPFSPTPVIQRSGCKHCLPVLWYPAHCELRNHLSNWMPPDLKYCMSCKIFTSASAHAGESPGRWRHFCGGCGEDYGSQGCIRRQRVQVHRPGETPERIPRFYNDQSL